MNIFLCHTPLHLLLAALELPKHEQTHNFFFVMEDVPGIHELANALLSPSRVEFSMLPGTASHASPTPSTIDVQKQNAHNIKKKVIGHKIDRIFIFFDQRAEAQAILNHPFPNKPLITWLEDGVTTYNVASPFPRPFRRLIKHKMRFDLRWKGSKWLGQHPMIDEIRCFYPNLLRDDLKKMKVDVLPHRLDGKYVSAFLEFYGKEKFHRNTGVIILPHPDSGISPPSIAHFISESVRFFQSIAAEPTIKIHPRDAFTPQKIDQLAPHIRMMQQNFPMELIMFAEKNIGAITGFRTSALHVTAALHPFIKARYYEPDQVSSANRTDVWVDFFKEISVPPLTERARHRDIDPK